MRGSLSRAWQRLLDADLHTVDCAPSAAGNGNGGGGGGGGAREIARDGEAGAAWAAGARGEELVLLLPH